jgi:hypothetical protein
MAGMFVMAAAMVRFMSVVHGGTASCGMRIGLRLDAVLVILMDRCA